MAQTIRLSDTDMNVVRSAAKRNRRSIAAQAAHWISIGRAIERSPAFDPSRLEAVLDAQLDFDALTPQEQAVFTDALLQHARDPQKAASEGFAALGAEAAARGFTE